MQSKHRQVAQDREKEREREFFWICCCCCCFCWRLSIIIFVTEKKNVLSTVLLVLLLALSIFLFIVFVGRHGASANKTEWRVSKTRQIGWNQFDNEKLFIDLPQRKFYSNRPKRSFYQLSSTGQIYLLYRNNLGVPLTSYGAFWI